MRPASPSHSESISENFQTRLAVHIPSTCDRAMTLQLHSLHVLHAHGRELAELFRIGSPRLWFRFEAERSPERHCTQPLRECTRSGLSYVTVTN